MSVGAGAEMPPLLSLMAVVVPCLRGNDKSADSNTIDQLECDEKIEGE